MNGKIYFLCVWMIVIFAMACNTDPKPTNAENKENAEVASQDNGSTSSKKTTPSNDKCGQLLEKMQAMKIDTFANASVTPTNFEECLKALDEMAHQEMKEWIKCLPDGKFGTKVHHGLGRSIRNSWGLWGKSPLAHNLTQMGILHADDMSAIIFDSYQRKLKGEELNLDEQLKSYQDYWREQGMNVDSLLKAIM